MSQNQGPTSEEKEMYGVLVRRENFMRLLHKNGELSQHDLNELYREAYDFLGMEDILSNGQFRNVIELLIENGCDSAKNFKIKQLTGNHEEKYAEIPIYEKNLSEAEKLEETLSEDSEITYQSPSQEWITSTPEKPFHETRMHHKSGLQGAVLERGLSFIEAAELILRHSGKKDSVDMAYLQAMKTVWQTQNFDDVSQASLAQLEKALIDFINLELYDNKKPFKKVKDELDNAENHANWKQRETLSSTIKGTSKVTRTDTPLSKFTNSQKTEWFDILGEEIGYYPIPSWFQALPQWEQNYLKERLIDWRNNHDDQNLGEFLGPLPTTIRRYPGSANAFKSEVTVGNLNIQKIRTGVVVPYKLRANSSKKRQEKVEITKQNIEQLVVIAIEEKIKALQAQGHDPNIRIRLPILYQSLFSPPFQPPGQYNQTALKKALAAMRKELADPNAFLAKHKIQSPYRFEKLDLLYANRPVNKIRGLAWIANGLSWQGQEALRTQAYFSKTIQQQTKILGKHASEDLLLAKAALKSMKQIKLTQNTLAGIRLTKHNAMAEKAGLEQIAACKLGMCIDGCVSGKDREEMISEIAAAQLQFYENHKQFPPPYDRKKNNSPERQEFLEMAARQFLSGHGQKLAGMNAKGCDGIKNIQDVLGKDICHKIRELAPEYGINPKVFDPVVSVQKVAGLNKIKAKKLKVDAQKLVDKVLLKMAGKAPKVFERFTPALNALKEQSLHQSATEKPEVKEEEKRKRSAKRKK